MKSRPEIDKASTAPTVKALSEKSQTIKKGTIMSDSTQVAPSRAITVPFHGAELYVVEHNGQPYTPMKPIVQAIGLDWGSQFRKVAASEGRWGIVNLTIPSAGGEQAMTCLPVRKSAAWLTTIEPGKVKNPEVRARVIQYQNECDDVLWQYWNDGAAINPRAFSVHPGQTLSQEQADTLRNMLTGRVKKLPQAKQAGAMVKGWSKLKSHFKTDYRHIPVAEFHEAVNILARHIAEWEVVDEESPQSSSLNDAARLQHAFTLASQTAAKVQQAVFNGVMSGNADWQRSRYLLNLDVEGRDQEVVVRARQVEHNACVAPIDRFHDVIEESITVDAQTLSQLASTCMARLSRMAQRAVPAATQAIGAAA